jgi:hypothetical protein
MVASSFVAIALPLLKRFSGILIQLSILAPLTILAPPSIFAPGCANAESIRQRGDEMLEAAVMESAAIVDAVRSSLEGAQVVNVLYGEDALGLSLAPGSYVQIDALPSLTEPTYESRERDAALLYEGLTEKFLEKNLVRLLLFRQRDYVGALYRFGFAPPRQFQPKPMDPRMLSPRVALGRHSLTWLSFFDREENTRGGWTDSKWLTKAMVEDLAGVVPLAARAPYEALQQSFYGPPNNIRHPLRYYAVSQDISTWKEVLDRVQRAIAVRAQFDQVRALARPDQQVNFYLSMIKDERIYSSYALSELERTGSPALAVGLLTLRPKIKFFVDDVWETALRLTQTRRTEDLKGSLDAYVAKLSSVSEETCRDPQKYGAIVSAAEKENLAINKELRIGFVERGSLVSSLSKIYETELRCQAAREKWDLSQLTPQSESMAAILVQPDNVGLSPDEPGLLTVAEKVTPRTFRERQRRLEELKTPLLDQAWRSVISSPAGLRAMVGYCAEGLENYREIAFPDRTRGRYEVWRRGCELLEKFEPPLDYCPTPDSRILREQRDVENLLGRSVLAAIANDDEQLLNESFALFSRQPSLQKAKLAAILIRQSREFSKQPLRLAFIASLQRLPYFPVAEALAEEFSAAGIREAQSINKTMKQLTGFDAGQQARSKDWIAYLTELAQRDEKSREKPLLNRDSLLESLSRPSCDRAEYGWNRLFRGLSL